MDKNEPLFPFVSLVSKVDLEEGHSRPSCNAAGSRISSAGLLEYILVFPSPRVLPSHEISCLLHQKCLCEMNGLLCRFP